MAHGNPLMVLVHSPLVGPQCWGAVVHQLHALGRDGAVPVLRDNGRSPFWSQHAEAVRWQLARRSASRPLLLVGHSGAGPLLPLIARACGGAIAGYLFVDAGLPAPGSRLDAMEREAPAFARRLREAFAAGQRFQAWTDDDLRPVLPDAHARGTVIASMRPRGLAFFTEPIPQVEGWPDAPCGYLQFSAAYDVPAAEARGRGWPVVSLDAGHFHMLVDPVGVAAALLGLAESAGIAFGDGS